MINVCAFIKTNIVLFGKKNKPDSLLNGEEEIKRNLKYVKNKIKETNSSRMIRCRFPKRDTKDQPENVFVFDLETCNNQKLAEAYGA